jgi:hypothetical protein
VAAAFVPARALMAKALAALVLAAPAAAQTGVDANPPPVSSGTLSPSELTAHFVASAIPNATSLPPQAAWQAQIHTTIRSGNSRKHLPRIRLRSPIPWRLGSM